LNDCRLVRRVGCVCFIHAAARADFSRICRAFPSA
jgi:hypothetical protein